MWLSCLVPISFCTDNISQSPILSLGIFLSMAIWSVNENNEAHAGLREKYGFNQATSEKWKTNANWCSFIWISVHINPDRLRSIGWWYYRLKITFLRSAFHFFLHSSYHRSQLCHRHFRSLLLVLALHSHSRSHSHSCDPIQTRMISFMI